MNGAMQQRHEVRRLYLSRVVQGTIYNHSPQSEFLKGGNNMKIVCFDDYKLGVLKGADTVVDITPVVRDAAQGNPRLLIMP